MDSIRVFLDNMFFGIAPTPSVLRAKEELLALMEDKYHELKANGMSEHAAVGQVIAEFGDLEELADDLGIRQDLHDRDAGTISDIPTMYRTEDEIQIFLENRAANARTVGFGVMLCILSPVLLLILSGLSERGHLSESTAVIAGLITLFASIVVAIILFIAAGEKGRPFEQYETTLIEMDARTKQFIEERYEKESTRYAVQIGASIGLIFFGIMIVVIASLREGTDDLLVFFAAAALLLCIALAVFFLIQAGSRRNALNLVQNIEDYTPVERAKNASMAQYAGPYWTLVTIIYLAWSFLTMDWHITWVVWPIAGLASTLLYSIVNVFGSRKP